MSAKEGPTWTKGEWIVKKEAGDVYVRVSGQFPDDWYICRLSLGNGAVVGNANLLSAAPEMAEALRRIVAAPYGLAIGDLEFAEAALAKARGEK